MTDKRTWPALRLEVTGFTVAADLWAFAQQACGDDQHIFPVDPECVLIVNGKLGRPLPGRSRSGLALAGRPVRHLRKP
jgi:hypothetical protein